MPDTKQTTDKSKRQVTINGKLEIIPKDNSDGWYGHCEVDFNNLLEENKKLKKENDKLKISILLK